MLIVNKGIKKIVDGKEQLTPIKDLRVKYNGTEKAVSSGDEVDVRDFGILHAQIKNVEAHLIKKHPGIFTQEDRATDSTTVKEFQKTIDALKVENVDVRNRLDAANKVVDDLRQKLAETENEKTGYGQQIASLTEQVNDLKARIKALDYPDAKKKKA